MERSKQSHYDHDEFDRDFQTSRKCRNGPLKATETQSKAFCYNQSTMRKNFFGTKRQARSILINQNKEAANSSVSPPTTRSPFKVDAVHPALKLGDFGGPSNANLIPRNIKGKKLSIQ